jgi:hypothetical protein
VHHADAPSSFFTSLFTFQGEAVDIETAKQKEDTVGGIVVGMDQQTLQE